VATKRNQNPQDVTYFVLVAGLLGAVIATWFGYPGVPAIWISVVAAVWLTQPPILTGKKDFYGYPAPANAAEERKLSRHQAASSLRASLILPLRDIVPGRPVRAAWVSSLVVAGVGYEMPVIGSVHLAATTGHLLNALFSFILVAALSGALRRAKGSDNPGIRFDTWRDYVSTRRVRAIVTTVCGVLLGAGIGYALLAIDARYGPSLGEKALSITGKTRPGILVANPLFALLAMTIAGAWFAFLISWGRVATEGFANVTNTRAQWKYRWMSLKFDPPPSLVDHEVLADGVVIIDTFDAPAQLGAIEFLKGESRLSPLVNAGERVALLSSPDEGPAGKIPGTRSAIRFRAVTWSANFDVSSPDTSAELAALWIQSGLAWVSHSKGVPWEPLPGDIVAASDSNSNIGEIVSNDESAETARGGLTGLTSAVVRFFHQVKQSSPTTSTLEATLVDEAVSPDDVGSDDTPLEAPDTAIKTSGRKLWRTTWHYSDDTIGPQVFRDVALAELETALRSSVLIDHRDGGTLYVGDLDSDDINDPITVKALLKVRTEDLWRQVWQSSVKSGANLPVPQLATYAERALANGTTVYRMAFTLNLGNDPLDYKYAGVEGKLKSALGLGRTSGASFAAVTGYPDLKNGGRPGDRHPQAIYVLWSFDPVPGTPKALAPSLPADQWMLAGMVNDAFSNLKLPHPEVVSVRCLTLPLASEHAWEVQLRLYGGVTTGNVRAAAGKIADNLATPWVRVSDAPDGCVLYCGVAPEADMLASPTDVNLVASLDWEQAFLVSHVVGSVGSVPLLVNTGHLPANEDVQVLEFELPPGLDKTTLKIASSKLRTATGNEYLEILDSENGPTFVTIQASVENPLPPMVPFNFAAADRSIGMAFATGVDGEPVEFVPKQDVHLAIIGKSGSGKTVAAQALLYGAAIKGYEIYVIDPMKGAADFKFLEPYTRAMATTIHDSAATLKAIYAEVERRKNLNASHGTASIADLPDGVRPAPILVFIDEFTSLITFEKVQRQSFDDPDLEAERQQQLRISNDRMSIAYYTGKLAREARSAGVSLGLGTQKLMAASLEAVPAGGDLKANLSRLLLGPTSQGERMSALRAFDQSPDPGETMPQGRGVWESSIRTGILIQTWYAPASVLGEELAKRIEPLSTSDQLDVTPFLSRDIELPGFIDEDEDEVIDLGEMSISLDDLASTGDIVEIPIVAEVKISQPAPWQIDWNTPSQETKTPIADDDPFALPVKTTTALPLDNDPFA
jgi:hypothetical protein